MDLHTKVKKLQIDSSLWLACIGIFSLTLFLLWAYYSNFHTTANQQFSFLSLSFLKGHLYFDSQIPLELLFDSAQFNGRLFWVNGPFPSVMLLPFVYIFQIFGKFFLQGYLSFFITGGVFWATYTLSKKIGYKKQDAVWLAAAFCFASVFAPIAFFPVSWYVAQAIVVLLLFLSLLEHFHKNRLWLIGLILGLVLATRVTAGLTIIFFIIEIVRQRISIKERLLQSGKLLWPFLLCLGLLLSYNALRFNNPLENGYTMANNWWASQEDRHELNNYGLFRLQNIPTNFYYAFVKTIDPVVIPYLTPHNGSLIKPAEPYMLQPPFVKATFPGVGFFVASPIFLYMFLCERRRSLVQNALITCAVVLPIILAYYWPGWAQIGPRYLLDILPFAFLALLYSFKNFNITTGAKIIILASGWFNLWLLITLMGPNR